MKTLPNYDLYGSEAKPAWLDTFSFEWIPERSRRYNWEIDPHTHDALIQLLYVRGGSGEVLIDCAKWTIDPSCLIVIPAGTVHGFQFSPDIDGLVVTAAQRPLEAMAAVTGQEMLRCVRSSRLMALPPATPYADGLMPLFHALERESRFYAPGQIVAGTSLLLAIFVQITRIESSIESARGAAQSRKTARIEKFRALVERHFRDRLPVERYAQELNVSAGQLARLCREALGMSPLDAINARLVHEAQRELVYSVLSVKEIAAALGFEDEAYFGRFFKKQTGLTATEFRDMARGQLALAPDDSG